MNVPKSIQPPAGSLPQCYLADLPPEAELTPGLIREAWLALERNRDQHLTAVPTHSVICDLETAAQLWLQDGSSYMALALGTEQLGFPKQILAEGLRQLFTGVVAPQLETWVEQDLGHPNRLDDFCATGQERASKRRSKAIGPKTLAHITAGTLPVPTVTSMVAGVLVRSAQFVKCASGSSLIPRLFAHSIREVNPHLGASIEIAEWPRQRVDLLDALIAGAECVTATGTDEAVGSLRQAVPLTKRFVGYGHRVSFAYLASDSLAAGQVDALAATIARDVCTWNQLGCLSPHVVYVEAGGAATPEAFAGQLALALDALEKTHPRGSIPDGEAATIRARRSFYEIRAAHSSETLLWQSEGSTAWTVVYEADPQFQASCLNRFVYVKGVDGLETVLQGADPVRHHVSTVALAASAVRTAALAARLADWGVTRICPVGCMQAPPLSWRHDGRPVLSDLVRWTDWEGI